MSDNTFPRVAQYLGGTRDKPAVRFEIEFNFYGVAGYILDLPTAIRLRDRLSEAIAAAQGVKG